MANALAQCALSPELPADMTTVDVAFFPATPGSKGLLKFA
jgi:hypothetical protein